MRFMGTTVHAEDLAEARPGAFYFIVREGRTYWKKNAALPAVRLQSLPPKRLGILQGQEGLPSVERRLLGMVKVVNGRAGKELRPLTPEQERQARAAAEAREAQLLAGREGSRVH